MRDIPSSSTLLLSPSPSLTCYSSGNNNDTLAEIAARVAHELSLHERDLKGDDLDNAEEFIHHKSEQELPPLDEEEEDGVEDEEFEFVFVCRAPESSPISADEIFHNGQIRPMYEYPSPINSASNPFAGSRREEYEKQRIRPRRPPLKLLMREDAANPAPSCSSDVAARGTYCMWAPQEAPNQPCRKSCSAGPNSRRWKLKHLLVNRRNSDGRAAGRAFSRVVHK